MSEVSEPGAAEVARPPAEPAEPGAGSEAPYPGLRPFRRDETDIFFGREQQVDDLLQRLERSHFIAVVGPSGCGKSSLVRTGLIPALESGWMTQAGSSWRVADMRPGASPLDALADALLADEALGPELTAGRGREVAAAFLRAGLRRSRRGLTEVVARAGLPEGTNLLLLVDQFEEVFRIARAGLGEADELAEEPTHGRVSEVERFVAQLVAAQQASTGPLYVLLTMRLDYLSDCARFRGLPEALTDNQYLTPRLNRAQLEAAITGPAEVFGDKVQRALVTRLLNDVGPEADQLPVLQHVLMRMWDLARRRQEPPIELTLDDYEDEAIGGLDKALSNHADEEYAHLGEEAARRRGEARQHVAQVLFRRLTERGSRERDTRAPAPLGQIEQLSGEPLHEVRAVVEAFRRPGCSFLMPLAGPLDSDTVLDISHESLIRQWRKLNGWVQAEARAASTFRRLRDAARRGSERLRGADLDEALELRRDPFVNEAWAERYGGGYGEAFDFVTSSQWRRRLWQGFSYLFAAGTLLLAALGLYTWYELDRQSGFLSDALVQRSLMVREARPDLAMALALEAYGVADRAAARSHLLSLLGDEVLLDNVEGLGTPIGGHRDNVIAAAFSPDGRQLATGDRAGELWLWDVESGAPLERLLPQGAAISGLAFSADELTARSEDGTLRVWTRDAAGTYTPRRFSTLQHAAPVLAVAIDAAETRVASADESGAVILWDLESRRPAHALESHDSEVYALAFTPDGSQLASGSHDGTLKVWDVETGKLLWADQVADSLGDLAFSPDGRWLAASSLDALLVFDLADPGGLRAPLRPPGARDVLAVAFGPEGRLASANAEGRVRLWPPTEKAAPHELYPSSQEKDVLRDELWALAYSPDGRALAAGGPGGGVVIDTATQQHHRLEAPTGIESLVFTPDGAHIVASTAGSTLILLDAGSGALIDEWVKEESSAFRVAMGGGTLVVGGHQGVVTWSDVAGQRRSAALGARPPAAETLAFDATGDRVALVTQGGAIQVWDTESDQLLGALDPVRGRSMRAVAFQPGGDLIAAGGSNGAVALWSAGSREVLHLEQGSGSDVSSLVFTHDPEGAEGLATGHLDGTILLWRLDRYSDRGGRAATRLRSRGRLAKAGAVLALAHRDGTLAAGDDTGALSIWGGPDLDLLARRSVAHQGPIETLAFSTDGRRLASGGADDAALIWDTETRRPTASLQHHRGDLLQPSFSGDGARIAVTRRAGQVIELDVGRTLSHAGPVRGVAISPDGRRIATAVYDNTVRVWDAPTRELLRTLHGHSDRVEAVAFSPQGVLASGGRDGRVLVWDDRGEPRLELLRGTPSQPRPVNAICFSRDGLLAAGGPGDEGIQVWDASQGDLVCTLEGTARSLAFSPDGSLLAASGDRGVLVWEMAAGSCGSLRLDLELPLTHVVAFDPGAVRLATLGSGGLATWDAALGGKQGGVEIDFRRALGLAFQPDGQLIAVGDYRGQVQLFETETLERIGEPVSLHGQEIGGLAFRPDGRELASSSADATVKLTELERLQRRALGASGAVGSHDLAVAPDGSVAVSTLGNGSLALRKLATGERLDASFLESTDPALAVLSSTGRALAAAGVDGSVTVWDLERRRARARIPAGAGPVAALALNTAGDLLAVVRGDAAISAEIELWKDGVDAKRLLAGGRVRALAFQPEGRLLASGGDDSRVRLWDVSEDRYWSLDPPLEHADAVTSLAFSANGEQLAAGTARQGVELWDPERRRRLFAVPPRHSDELRGVALSRDGRSLATAGLDGRVVIWSLDQEHWLRRACARLGQVSDEDLLQHLPEGTTPEFDCEAFLAR